METIEVARDQIWKYRSVNKILKSNNGKVTKSEPTGTYIKKNHIKKLDFKTYTVKPLIIPNLFGDDEDFIWLTIIKL